MFNFKKKPKKEPNVSWKKESDILDFPKDTDSIDIFQEIEKNMEDEKKNKSAKEEKILKNFKNIYFITRGIFIFAISSTLLFCADAYLQNVVSWSKIIQLGIINSKNILCTRINRGFNVENSSSCTPLDEYSTFQEARLKDLKENISEKLVTYIQTKLKERFLMRSPVMKLILENNINNKISHTKTLEDIQKAIHTIEISTNARFTCSKIELKRDIVSLDCSIQWADIEDQFKKDTLQRIPGKYNSRMAAMEFLEALNEIKTLQLVDFDKKLDIREVSDGGTETDIKVTLKHYLFSNTL